MSDLLKLKMGLLRELRRGKNPNLEKYKCENCGNLFWRRVRKASNKSNPVGVRGVGYQTCGKRCSMEFCHTF